MILLSFKTLNIKNEYRSFQDNIVFDFYIPTLKYAVKYDRAVGYFSSTALIDITRGIGTLIKNNGKIRLVVSPKLSKEDIESIRIGYKNREDLIQNCLLNDFNREFDKEFDFFEMKRLNLLAYLISNHFLEIKIALIQHSNSFGMFHEKLGIIEDVEGNVIAFSGSLNETSNAFSHNYEAIDVFKSWTADWERVNSKQSVFESIWDDKINGISTVNFPHALRDKLLEYRSDDLDLCSDIDENEYYYLKSLTVGNKARKEPSFPTKFKLRDYQKKAIEQWEKNNFQGIFNMATGTGKTYTSLAAATHLSQLQNYRLAIIVVCPYQHLVEQWVKNIKDFNLNPIVGYSSSKQKTWKKRLQTHIEAFNLGIKENFCFVTTNASFATTYVQDQIKKIEQDYLLIIDEAHNFGANKLYSKLPSNAKFRIALSATIQRHNDVEGTESLMNYFGETCINYTLEMAIRNGMLTPYYYYPVLVYLTKEELNEYQLLTSKIGKLTHINKNGNSTYSDSVKMLLLKRAKLIAGAANKLQELEKTILPYKDASHTLIYCGATTINDLEYNEFSPDDDEKRQIDAVVNLLGNTLNMKVSKFTSEETAIERETIKNNFVNGNHLQALVAIRCLDEGVDIPSIKRAFILASSTNPKEYIQRRGRVLRNCSDKEYAEIYDFITLPMKLEEIGNYSEKEINSIKSLLFREIERMRDFTKSAENSSVSDKLIKMIENSFSLYKGEIFLDEFKEH